MSQRENELTFDSLKDLNLLLMNRTIWQFINESVRFAHIVQNTAKLSNSKDSSKR